MRSNEFVEFDSGVIHPSIPLSKSALRAIVGADVGTNDTVGAGVGRIVGTWLGRLDVVGTGVGTLEVGAKVSVGEGLGSQSTS